MNSGTGLEETLLLGKLLGKEQKAEKWIARYLEKVRQAKRRLEGHIGVGNRKLTFIQSESITF
ncbi:hypothetical protein M3650_02610 [Paenibacillus sp. MER TA 81-3]|uniref:hypothetical protein n=1 Tax=Paenibacillus sp. MER TA 81-3 TaxID=2939573 RepID=UPI00203AF9BC|nr:hypothetical protein [Paenibacillus sp. MER TA 81-3]MCM3337566.1 hypothetical protein [Paenibacillus sp. MER TA 81-3]